MKFVASLLFCWAAASALAQTNFTPISNTSQSAGETVGIWNISTLAQSFTTSNADTVLYSVSLLMGNRNGSGGGPLIVSVYNDAGDSPGSSLRTLSGNSAPASAGVYTFTNTNALTLSSNTTYWIVASSPGSTGPTAYQWYITFSSGLDAGSFWTLGTAKNNSGTSWSSSGTGVYQQFGVTVNNPTPPTINISQPIVLTYPQTEFPFVVQQTTNLGGSNWVAVTNAVLSGVLDNQNVVILPPNAQQMFYRLELAQ